MNKSAVSGTLGKIAPGSSGENIELKNAHIGCWLVGKNNSTSFKLTHKFCNYTNT